MLKLQQLEPGPKEPLHMTQFKLPSTELILFGRNNAIQLLLRTGWPCLYPYLLVYYQISWKMLMGPLFYLNNEPGTWSAQLDFSIQTLAPKRPCLTFLCLDQLDTLAHML